MTGRPQMPLPFPHTPAFAPEDFLRAPSNEAAMAWLERTQDWPDRRLALWGQPGVGKSHLLHLWASRAGAIVLRGTELRDIPPLTDAAAIAVDDADAAAQETALLHLLNAAHEAAGPVLLAGRLPPARWQFRLPDLMSRLRAVTAVEIAPLEEALLRQLLLRLLADRQLAAKEPLQDWLLRRVGRSPAALREAVERLDRAGLAAGRSISRTLAAAVLAEMDEPASEPVSPYSPTGPTVV